MPPTRGKDPNQDHVQNTPYTRLTPMIRTSVNHTPHFAEARRANMEYNALKWQNRLVPVAASGFPKVPDLQPPRCPHIFPPAQQHYSQMALHLNKVYDGTGIKGNFFRADSHHCGFFVLIPDLEEYKSKYITTQEAKDEFDNLNGFDDDDANLDPFGPDPSHSSLSSSSPATSSAHASSPSTSISSEQEVELYLLNGDPRMPRPSDSPPALSGPFKPFFNKRVAKARSTVDLQLIADVVGFDKNDFYKNYPHLHPLTEKPPVAVMRTYDQETATGCLIRAFSNLEHIDSHLSRALREFNSLIGIPAGTWKAIVGNATTCSCCLCSFSFDGYNSHINQGRCSMVPAMEKVLVPRRNAPHTPLAVRTYPHDYRIPLLEDFMETPTGVAFTEWNSRIGVPLDVWMLLSTAGVECETCHLRRSWEGHRAHFGEDNSCNDPGDIGASLASVQV
ncbi:hypothetical protein B0H17DRAFT_1144798 [Mycena rosella]|uniref:Uncharacterized protein n=1 Tax=Mycena rosella TaxID=1033263 RepID=A0AAD7CVZ0_MYCRO|nr:hypothetical protein B0H17DRAFT_1144798 [Mycena rosella]